MKLKGNYGFTTIGFLIIALVVIASAGASFFVLKNKQPKNETNKQQSLTEIKKLNVPGLCIPELSIQTDLPADKFYFDMESGVGAIVKDNGKGIVLYPIYAGSEKSFLDRKNTSQSSFVSKKGLLTVHKIEDQNNHSVIYLVQSLPYPLLITIFNQAGASSTKKDSEIENDISLLIDSMTNKKCEPNPKEFKNDILTKLEANKPINIWFNSIDSNSKSNFELAYSILKSRFDIDTSKFNENDYFNHKSGSNLYVSKDETDKTTNPYHDVFVNKTDCADYILYKTIQNLPQKDKDYFLKIRFFNDTIKYSVEEQIYIQVRSYKFQEQLNTEISDEKINDVHFMANDFDLGGDWKLLQKLTGEHCKNIGISFK